MERAARSVVAQNSVTVFYTRLDKAADLTTPYTRTQTYHCKIINWSWAENR